MITAVIPLSGGETFMAVSVHTPGSIPVGGRIVR